MLIDHVMACLGLDLEFDLCEVYFQYLGKDTVIMATLRWVRILHKYLTFYGTDTRQKSNKIDGNYFHYDEF